MVYAMFSIGILGFIVWSRTVALLYCKMGVTNLAICWKSLVLTNTLNSKNFASYTQSAGNPYTLSLKSPSETICEISCQNFNTFNKIYRELGFTTYISDHWLSWFIGFTE